MTFKFQDDPAAPGTGGPVGKYGRLQVDGCKIKDKNNEPVSLAGVSFFSSCFKCGADFYDRKCVRWLKKDWNAFIVRVALNLWEGDWNLKNPQENLDRAVRVIDAAIEADIYVLIDWHDHYANNHEPCAIEFFDLISKRYASFDHVVYEIFNEPMGSIESQGTIGLDWRKQIKPYSERVIATIRHNDPEKLIVVGTPNWSQHVDVAAEDPITDINVAYALHFYADAHEDHAPAIQAMKNGKALFVTEWGTCWHDGHGEPNVKSTLGWMEFLKTHAISHCNWAVANQNHWSLTRDRAQGATRGRVCKGASILAPDVSKLDNWEQSDLSDSGQLVKDIIYKWPNNYVS